MLATIKRLFHRAPAPIAAPAPKVWATMPPDERYTEAIRAVVAADLERDWGSQMRRYGLRLGMYYASQKSRRTISVLHNQMTGRGDVLLNISRSEEERREALKLEFEKLEAHYSGDFDDDDCPCRGCELDRHDADLFDEFGGVRTRLGAGLTDHAPASIVAQPAYGHCVNISWVTRSRLVPEYLTVVSIALKANYGAEDFYAALETLEPELFYRLKYDAQVIPENLKALAKEARRQRRHIDLSAYCENEIRFQKAWGLASAKRTAGSDIVDDLDD